MKESPGNAVSEHCSCSAAKLWVPKYSCRMGGDVQVCSGLKGLLGFNTSRRHLQPKALSLPCNPIWIVHGTGKRFPLVHHRSGGGWVENRFQALPFSAENGVSALCVL